MERWSVRRRLRQMHRLLVNSRSALECAGVGLRNKLLNDLLFMLACRRIIMLNLLDREMGTMGVPARPSANALDRFTPYLQGTNGVLTGGLMALCEQEETYLRKEMADLMGVPGLSGRTRQMLRNLISEVDEDLRDLDFAKVRLGVQGPRP